MCMGVNLRQGVSDAVYMEFVDVVRDVFVVQSNEYFKRKLRGKKYLILVNDEVEKPEVRFRIVSVDEAHDGGQEDVYGAFVSGPVLFIKLLRRDKTK